MSAADPHAAFMAQALALASRARPSPNPPVGAVVVRDGRVVGQGFHRAAGRAHAEVEALRDAGRQARGADLYVTLEPCNHRGRTPPCTDAILRAGVARVLFGVRDPNPRVRGGGAERLRAAGVAIVEGVGAAECGEQLAPFFRFVRSGRPFVTLKIASSLDGRIAARSGRSRWITGAPARRIVQRLRAAHDAVLVGAGTVEADDPRLTLRPPGSGVPPLRVVLAPDARFAAGPYRVFAPEPGTRTLLVAPGAGGERPGRRRAGVDLLRLPAGPDGWLPEADVLRALGERGVMSVLVEGGSAVFTRFLAAGLADRVALFLAPRLLGGPAERGWFVSPGVERPAAGPRLRILRTERCGGDCLVWCEAGRSD